MMLMVVAKPRKPVLLRGRACKEEEGVMAIGAVGCLPPLSWGPPCAFLLPCALWVCGWLGLV